MQHPKRTALGLGLASALVAIAPSARAQSFDAAPWVALTRGQAPVTDVVDAVAPETDVVGSAASPAAFVASDASFFYARVRVNDEPTLNDGSFLNASWGCLVDTNGALSSYEHMIVLTGQGQVVDWRHNAVESVGPNVPSEPAEVLVASFDRATHGRAVQVASGFGGNDDWLVEMAIPWATIRAGGNGAPAVVAGTPLRFVCGTGASFSLDTDQATLDAAGALTGSWSDPFVCGASGCAVDTDGDGVSDAVEVSFGMNPALADSDGDGIDDLVEVTPPGGGAPAMVDTDGDGVIDALDADSDGDGIADADESVVDPDGDGLPAFRDPDDDNDGILTKTELADAFAAGVTNDVDGDGLKNHEDRDSDGDGKGDQFEGRGDEDGDGIPDYLDPTNDAPERDAGPGSTLPPPPPESPDAGTNAAPAVVTDEGVVAGTGLLCASRPGDRGAAPSWLVLATGALAVAARLRRRARVR